MKEIVTEINGYKIIEYEKTHIFIIENLFDDIFCEKNIELINILALNKVEYSNVNNVDCFICNLSDELNKNISDEFYYCFPEDLNEYNNLLEKLNNNRHFSTNYYGGIKKKKLDDHILLFNDIMEKMGDIIKDINGKICFKYNSGYILRKITGKTRLHSDGINNLHESNITFIKDNIKGDYKMIRNSTVIMSLNDNYDGGEFIFPYFDITIKLKKGSVLIFPPFWTHEHETNELDNNTVRYTITTWNCDKIQ